MPPSRHPNRPRVLRIGLALSLTLAAGCSDRGDGQRQGKADASGTTWYGVKTDSGTPPTMQASMTPEAPAPAAAAAPAQGATDAPK